MLNILQKPNPSQADTARSLVGPVSSPASISQAPHEGRQPTDNTLWSIPPSRCEPSILSLGPAKKCRRA